MDANGNFLIVWASQFQDGSLDGVYGQRFDAAGAPQGVEFRVNTHTANEQGQPVVSMDSNGNAVVVWQSFAQDGSGYGIYAQRYDAAGVPQGSELHVSTATANDQLVPYVAVSANEFVVTWASAAQDGGGLGIYAQRYDATGNPQGSEFRVNSFTAGDQTNASVSISPNGEFVVVWESQAQDGSGKGIYAQRYNALAIPQGSEILANTFTTGDQSYPFVAKAPTGNFTIVWTSTGQDGSNEGVYGKRFDSAGNPLPIP
jgi:hypothetical protein